jgi:hypothetical protein
MRHDTSNAASEPCSSAIVPEYGSDWFVVLFKFNFVRIDRGDCLECLASSTFGVNHAMALKLYVKIFDVFQVYGVDSCNG